MHWTFLMAAVAVTPLAQGLLKAGSAAGTVAGQLLDWRTLAGLALYGAAALFYILALRRMPLSVALPCTALSYVLVAAVGFAVFDEPLGLARVAGLGLIAAGVVVLAAS